MNAEQVTLTVVMGIASAGFFNTAIQYMRLAPWYLTPIGRWFVGLHLALGCITALITINRAFNGEITRTVWVVIVLGLAVLGWGTSITVVRTQHRANPPEK